MPRMQTIVPHGSNTPIQIEKPADPPQPTEATVEPEKEEHLGGTLEAVEVEESAEELPDDETPSSSGVDAESDSEEVHDEPTRRRLGRSKKPSGRSSR